MIQTRNHVYIITTVAVLLSLLYFYFSPSSSHFFPACIFYSLTGLYCPGCGSQRAFHELLNGHFFQAANYNLLVVAFLPVIAFSAAVTINNIFGKKKYQQRLVTSNYFVWPVFAAVVIFWVLRNLPVYPFSWLAP